MCEMWAKHSLVVRRSSLIFLFAVLHIGSKVTGQPVLFFSPSIANCEESVTLTCNQTGFNSGTGRLWRKNTVKINENGNPIQGYERYIEQTDANNFALEIASSVPIDAGDYECEYNFSPSATESLQFHCRPTESNITCSRNDQNKLVLGILRIYPDSSKVKSVTLTPEGNAEESLNGTLSTPVANGNYFDFEWTSDGQINAETYSVKITVTTLTASTTVVTKQCDFGTTVPTTTTTTTTTATTSIPATATMSTSSTSISISTRRTNTATTLSSESASGSTKGPAVTRATAITVPTTSSTTTTPQTTTTTPVSLAASLDHSTHSPPTTATTSSADSDKGLVIMIIVVSVVGGILVIAICFMVFLMVHWKNCFGHRKHTHLSSHRQDKYRTRHRRDRLKYTRERSELDSFQPDHVLNGYQFYRGGVRNPEFEEAHEKHSPPFVYYRETLDMFHGDQPPEYFYANNWRVIEYK